jgi:hypothetical protein
VYIAVVAAVDLAAAFGQRGVGADCAGVPPQCARLCGRPSGRPRSSAAGGAAGPSARSDKAGTESMQEAERLRQVVHTSLNPMLGAASTAAALGTVSSTSVAAAAGGDSGETDASVAAAMQAITRLEAPPPPHLWPAFRRAFGDLHSRVQQLAGEAAQLRLASQAAAEQQLAAAEEEAARSGPGLPPAARHTYLPRPAGGEAPMEPGRVAVLVHERERAASARAGGPLVLLSSLSAGFGRAKGPALASLRAGGGGGGRDNAGGALSTADEAGATVSAGDAAGVGARPMATVVSPLLVPGRNTAALAGASLPPPPVVAAGAAVGREQK